MDLLEFFQSFESMGGVSIIGSTKDIRSNKILLTGVSPNRSLITLRPDTAGAGHSTSVISSYLHSSPTPQTTMLNIRAGNEPL